MIDHTAQDLRRVHIRTLGFLVTKRNHFRKPAKVKGGYDMRIQKSFVALNLTLMFALLVTLMFVLLAERVAPELKAQQTSVPTQKPTAILEKEKTGRDGARMVLIPAGEFQMGSGDGYGDESPVHTVYLDAFYIDTYEVTNTQYADFLNEYKNTDPNIHTLLDISSDYCMIEKVGDIFSPESGYEYHPVVMVSWYGAAAYAKFYSKRLPTEAEWEKAARGGLVGKQYPWGDNISHEDANYGGVGGRKETSPVGSFPPNGYGLYDMGGNVGEWCVDWHGKDYYSVCSRSNPVGPGSGVYRVLRGGSWLYNKNGLRVASRDIGCPTSTCSCHSGFRCAGDVTP